MRARKGMGGMYTEYFGFRERPFNVTPDPRFLYPTPACQEAYAALLYGIRERKGVLVLTGEVGTGKTTLLRKVITSLEDTIQFAFFYNTTLTFDELLYWVCVDFGLTVSERDGRLGHIQALNAFLLEQQEKGGTAVLFIDEAQNLDDGVLENLRLLSNLETAAEKLLQIILIGQPELEQKLAQPHLRALKQRITVQCKLGCLKEREVGPFIQHRLRAAGYEGAGVFSAEAVTRIWEYSRGTPRLINVLCDNALLLAYSLSQSHVTAPMVEEVASDLQLPRGDREGPQNEAEKWAISSVALEEWQQEATTLTDLPLAPPDALERPASRSRRPQSEPGGGFGWPRRRMPWAARSFSRQSLRVGAGLLLAFLLLGGTGAALYPQYTTEQLSQLGVAAKEVLRDTEDYLAAVQHDLLTWLTPPPVAETGQGDAQYSSQSPLAEPELSVQHPTTAPQHEQPAPVIEPSLPARAATRDENPTPTTPVHQGTTAAGKAPEEQGEPAESAAKDQSDTQNKDAEKPVSEKKKAEHPPQAQPFSPEDVHQKQAEARALLEQMGYAAAGTTLFASAENGNTSLISLLLTAGVSPDEQDATGWTPLMYAAWHGHTTTARELVHRGANVNTKNTAGGTALMVAAMNGHTAIAQTLWEKGADINVRDAKGWTPLMYAAWNGHTATAQALMKGRADINAKNEDGWTALMCAAWRGHVTTVQTLLERRAEPHLQSNDGETALMLATSQGNAKIMELLKSAGAQE